jgi:hypothetical protein
MAIKDLTEPLEPERLKNKRQVEISILKALTFLGRKALILNAFYVFFYKKQSNVLALKNWKNNNVRKRFKIS